jgi:hypothetical protein
MSHEDVHIRTTRQGEALGGKRINEEKRVKTIISRRET